MYKELVSKLREDSSYSDKCTLEIYDLCCEAADAIEILSGFALFIIRNFDWNAINRDGDL